MKSKMTTHPAFAIGDAVTINTHAPFARLGMTGTQGRGVIERVVTDTAPHPTRGPLYHIRLTDADAQGWLGSGYSRNYADELQAADTYAAPPSDGESNEHGPTCQCEACLESIDRDIQALHNMNPNRDAELQSLHRALDRMAAWQHEPPHDGEQLGSFVFDMQHVKAGHSGLWVFPAGYDDAALCQGRADFLTECFGVRFHAVPLLRIGDETEWYAAAGVSSTRELRRIVGRAMDRARGMTPRETADETTESEA